MPSTRDDVLSLLHALAREKGEAGPVTLDPAYLRAVARWEALPENAEGADKSWVLRADRDFVAVARRARLVG